MGILGQSRSDAALQAIEDFLGWSDSHYIRRWELATAWLFAAGIHYRQGRPVKALVSAVRAFLIRPIIAGRPVKTVFTRIVASLGR
jgi:hypothetical protein